MESSKTITICMHNKNRKYCTKCEKIRVSYNDMMYISNAIMRKYFIPSMHTLLQKYSDTYINDMLSFIKENIELLNHDNFVDLIFCQKKYNGFSICDLFLQSKLTLKQFLFHFYTEKLKLGKMTFVFVEIIMNLIKK